MKKLTILLGMILVAAGTGAATVYRQVQPDGTVVFTDQRPAGDSEEVEVPAVQTFEAPALPAEAPKGEDAGDGFQGYKHFAVASPANDETIRDNNGVVPIKLSLDPPLRRSDKVELLMDGQVLATGRSLSITLQSVDRGAHALEAKIRDKHGQELTRTAAITFFLQRVSKLSP